MKLCDSDVVIKFTKNKIRSTNIVNETFTKKNNKRQCYCSNGIRSKVLLYLVSCVNGYLSCFVKDNVI